MLQPEQGETQASFAGIGSRRIPSPMRRLACFFRNLYFSVFLCAANMPPRGAPPTWGRHQPSVSFFARYGGRRTAFFGVPYGFDEAVSQMGRGQIPPSGPPFAEHPCGGAPCGALCGVRGRVPERGVRVLPAVRSQCGSHRAVPDAAAGRGTVHRGGAGPVHAGQQYAGSVPAPAGNLQRLFGRRRTERPFPVPQPPFL